jgi:nucleotide-binding universal stress UspA family protein
VGVDGSAASVSAVRYAAAEAARSGTRVEVVHVVPDQRSVARRHRHRHRHPDVDVELVVVKDQAAPALVSASAQAQELLIQRRSHGFPAGTHLGSAARTVLLHAHCPVRVVPGTVVPAPAGLVLEAAGVPLT